MISTIENYNFPGCPKCFRVGFPIPVCGTDGESYRSKCELKEAACKTQNADLAVASQGKCAGITLHHQHIDL